MLSIIMPYHNEGIQFIKKTIDSLTSTIDIPEYEIIVVDDCSDVPLELQGVTVIRHTENIGVGAAFDTGVTRALYDNLILMGCDIRFLKNNWASKMIAEIESNENAMICSSTVAISLDELIITDNYISAFERERRRFKYNGARILFRQSNKDMPDMPDDFRTILNAQWLDRQIYSLFASETDNKGFKEHLKRVNNIDYKENESYEVPCILGAFYGVRKRWYQYIDGFWGHKQWGTLEPYISLKSWMFGGNCLTAPHIETAHIFKENGTHDTPFASIIYNKLLVANLLFYKYEREMLINHLPSHDYVDKAKNMIKINNKEIQKKRMEYVIKSQMDVTDYIKKFNLNF